jgi:ribosomal protein S18 acetylase RimI-like enzyme
MITSRAAVTAEDLEYATEIMTTAFASDPVWGGWAFPIENPIARNEARRRFWCFSLASALRYPWLRLTTGAAALWVPPNGSELTDAEEAEVEPMLRELVGAHTEAFLECLDLFESNRPRQEPHYYLSLLGTHNDYRGQGVGMQLLSENLELIDREEMPSYLESTNPANIARYESVGFRRVGSFNLPAGGPTVDTMWREAKS